HADRTGAFGRAWSIDPLSAGRALLGGLVRPGGRLPGPGRSPPEEGCPACVGLLQAGVVLSLGGAVVRPDGHDGLRSPGSRRESAPAGVGHGARRRLAVRDAGALGSPAEPPPDRGGGPVAGGWFREVDRPCGGSDGEESTPAAVGTAQPGRAGRPARGHRGRLDRPAGAGRVARPGPLAGTETRRAQRPPGRAGYRPRPKPEPLRLRARDHAPT